MTLRPEQTTPPPTEYVPVTFTLPDGQRALVTLFLPPGVRPLRSTLAIGYDTELGHRWGPPIASDQETP